MTFRRAFALSLITLVLMPVQVKPATAVFEVIAGVCEITLEVTRTGSTGNELDIKTSGAGDCTTTDGPADGFFVGGAAGMAANLDCAQGVADGVADFSLTFSPVLTRGWVNTDLEVAYAGGVATLVFFRHDTEHIVGTGQFVQSPTAAEACLYDLDEWLWSGVITFEDPELEDLDS